MSSSENHEFLYVKSGDYVAIANQKKLIDQRSQATFWIGKVINCIGGARNPNSWTLFQVINIDTGEISIVNADTVKRIINKR